MADLARMERALIAADKAGDTEAARTLARAIRAARAGEQAAAEPAPDPSAGGGTLSFAGLDTAIRTPQGVDRFLSGAGKAFVDTGRGLRQLAVETGEKIGLAAPGAGRTLREQADEQRALDAPLMATGAGKTGNIAANIAATAPLAAIPGASTYPGAMAIGGLLGSAQPVGTDDSRLFNTGLGIAGGAGGKYVGDRLSRALTRPRPAPQAQGAARAGAQAQGTASVGQGASAAQTTVNVNPQLTARGGGYTFGHVGDDASAGLNAAERRAFEGGRAIGMRATPGVATGSRALQQMEAKLESQPMTSGPFNTIKANNARQLARAAAHEIGEQADVVNSEVLDRAFTRLGNVFEDAADDVPRAIDPQDFVQRYQGWQDELEGVAEGFGKNPLIERLTKLATEGRADGRQLHQLSSKLGKAAYKQMTSPSGDRDMGQTLYSVKEYVDDLLTEGMEPERLARFMEARQQWRQLSILTKPGVVNPSKGTVNGPTYARALAKADKAGFLRGQRQSPGYEAARFAQAFQPIVGDSGTATRMPLQGLTDMAMRIPMNIATRAYTSTPAVNLAMGAQAGAQAAGNAVMPPVQAMLGPFAPAIRGYAPIAGGLFGAQLPAQ